eukprot:Nk52_evm5s232 gene=Nk52_evmTU5s232
MEILRSNFILEFKRIEKACSEADFFAFDFEMTGLDSNPQNRTNFLDDLEERYRKVKGSAENFLPIQFGLSCFRWDDEKEAFEVKTFNFYMFAEPLLNGKVGDRRFMSQTSSIKFLAQNNFDFNKLFHNGIPYLSRKQEVIYRDMIERREKMKENDSELSKKFGEKPTEEAILFSVGFRRVVDLVANSGKLIVGHNMFLDCLHLYHTFLEYLPNSYGKFKEEMHKVFPNIIDTKFLAEDSRVREFFDFTSLGQVAERVLKTPFATPKVIHAEDFDRYSETSDMCHEAGYDAYITGVSFVRLMAYLGEQDGVKFAPKDLLRTKEGKEYLGNYLNRLNIMRSDYACFRFDGDEQKPDRTNVFYVGGFPDMWKTQDLKDLFIEFGDCSVKWIDDTCALIVVPPVEDVVSKVMPSFEKSSPCTILTYAQFEELKRANITEPQTKKRKFNPGQNQNQNQQGGNRKENRTEKAGSEATGTGAESK